MFEINTYKFQSNTADLLQDKKYGADWPVVYVLSSDTEAYVGETVNASVRTAQHWANAERRTLTSISIIGDDEFNKSVILDLESYLIRYMSADGKYKMQNGNMGMHSHNYYDKSRYESQFRSIWNRLREEKLAQNTIEDIENSDLFKYSPYKCLSGDQYHVMNRIVEDIVIAIQENRRSNTIVCGGPGTGKTILAIYLMKLLKQRQIPAGLEFEEEMDPTDKYVWTNLQKLPDLKIGLVIPQQSLRQTLSNIFPRVSGLTKKMLLKPGDVPNETFDILIVDEAHRLHRRAGLAQYPSFDKKCAQLGLDCSSSTELDWILKCSKHSVLFYDENQSVRPSDIKPEVFNELISNAQANRYQLYSQLRCKGGRDYVRYVNEIIAETPSAEMQTIPNYEFRMFDDVEQMFQEIRKKDAEFGLCRMVSGYAWKWQSKHHPELFDIFIGPYQYRWNTADKDWVNSPNALNEIGSIHTVQGYDLNYVGVIIGEDIKYDPVANRIYADKGSYYDNLGKAVGDDQDALTRYICNIYRTLMTRGILGTYVYVCDNNLKDYLRGMIPVFHN